jgi:hypothetical protein
LANVRSAIAVTIALVLLLVLAPVAPAREGLSARLVLLPPGTTVDELAEAGFSPGLMSAGLGTVPAEQTYLDIGQGNRVFDSLYDEDLPARAGDRASWWRAVVERAESAPADIVPGLLSMTLRKAGVPADGFEIRSAPLAEASPRRGELLVAIARPTGESDDLLPIGIAGRGFDGELTSDSTRIDGYVLSTDVAPTLLRHFGVEVPQQMSGQPIEAVGSVDPAAIESLGARMAVISQRRGPVVGLNVVIWLVGLALVALLGRGRLARPAVRVVGLALVYLPLVLLLGAALEAGEASERLLVLLLAPLLGAATLLLLRGYRALAVASGLTALAYAIDLVAGSPLSSLSLLGPNPGLGVRFYGIGNELEALLAVLVTAGAGAALTGFSPKASSRACAVAFIATGLVAAIVFAAGRFGADVGAAIVFPLGAAVAAVTMARRGRGWLLLAAVAAPVAVLALLALIDLTTGANAHLTRSVLDAGGLGDLAEVAQRRLQLSAHSFARPVLLAFLPLVLGAAVCAYLRRDRLRAWLARAPAVRAGLAGALAATLVGTFANDSGALVLEIGTAYLLVFTGFAWAESAAKSGESTAADEKLQLRAPHV